jgi:hypothetical protein
MEGRQVTKNFKATELITNPKDIIDLAKEKKSVYVTVWKRTSPAAFLLSWQLRMIIQWVEAKRFYKIKTTKK